MELYIPIQPRGLSDAFSRWAGAVFVHIISKMVLAQLGDFPDNYTTLQLKDGPFEKIGKRLGYAKRVE